MITIIMSSNSGRLVIIALNGRAGAGKSTTAHIIKSMYGCEIISFAERLYKITECIQIILDKDVRKDPKLLQFLGEGLRGIYGENVWTSPTMEKISQEIINQRANNEFYPIVIDDLRYFEQLNALKGLSAKFDVPLITMKIYRDGEINDRDPDHRSEKESAELICDEIIYNNSDVDNLTAFILRALKDKFTI